MKRRPSQLLTQLMQLPKESLKKIRLAGIRTGAGTGAAL